MNHREEGLLLSLDIKSYIEYLVKEFKYSSMETVNPISTIEERLEKENLILPRVMEVLISN